MKILHVVHNYYPSLGGTQYLFQSISEKLVDKYKDDITVYTTDSYFGPQRREYKKIKDTESTINGVKIIRFGYFRFHFRLLDMLFKLFYHFKIPISEKLIQLRLGPISLGLNKALYNNEFDVVCASSSDYCYMLYPLYRKKGLKAKPFVFMGAFHFAENAKEDKILGRKIQAIKLSEYYIANTNFEKERLEEYGVPAKNIKVIGCGINLFEYENIVTSNIKTQLNINNDVVLGYFGRHIKTKGLEIVLLAFERLAKHNRQLSLIIAGVSSAYTQEIKNIISSFEEPIRNKCFLLENIPEKEKAAILQAFDIFVCPSVKESFGIAFLEAWANKKPVIGADIGAMRSVISHGQDGFLIKPDDYEDLITYCNTLITNKALRTTMGDKGYQKVKTSYTLDIIADKYRTVYEMAIAKHYKKSNRPCNYVNMGRE